MPIEITGDRRIVTMIHVYDTDPDKQDEVFRGLSEGLKAYGKRMAGHISSSIHKSVDGTKVTSYSQWDGEASKALFENPEALRESLAWFAPLTSAAKSQESHLYSEIFTYLPSPT